MNVHLWVLSATQSCLPRKLATVRAWMLKCCTVVFVQTRPSLFGRAYFAPPFSRVRNLYGCRIEIGDSYICDGRGQVPALHAIVTRHLFEKAFDLHCLRLRLKGVITPSPYRPGRMPLTVLGCCTSEEQRMA